MVEPIDETWIYSVDDNRWSQVFPRHTPGARAWHALAATNQSVVLFGGGESRSAYTNDTFLYDSRANAWRAVKRRTDDH